MRHSIAFALIVASLALPRIAAASPGDAPDSVAAAPASSQWKADPIFPGARHVSIGVGSGVPFLALGEVAYAPSNGFAIGAITGITPYVFGAGLRPRVGVKLGDHTRVSLVMPVLYYPTGDGLIGDGPPWFLAQPALRLERKIGDRGYAQVSAGLIGAIGFPARDQNGEIVETYNDRRVVEKGTPWGVWDTLGAGGSYAVFDRTVVFADAMGIFNGVKLAGNEWVGGPPFAFTLGVARTL